MDIQLKVRFGHIQHNKKE